MDQRYRTNRYIGTYRSSYNDRLARHTPDSTPRSHHRVWAIVGLVLSIAGIPLMGFAGLALSIAGCVAAALSISISRSQVRRLSITALVIGILVVAANITWACLGSGYLITHILAMF